MEDHCALLTFPWLARGASWMQSLRVVLLPCVMMVVLAAEAEAVIVARLRGQRACTPCLVHAGDVDHGLAAAQISATA
jgi:hypothetical protein